MIKVFLKNARIVDGTGAPAIENGLLVYVSTVEESEEQHGIVYVGKMDEAVLAQATEKDRVIDLKNEYTLTPGLVNTHVHLDLQMPGVPTGGGSAGMWSDYAAQCGRW